MVEEAAGQDRTSTSGSECFDAFQSGYGFAGRSLHQRGDERLGLCHDRHFCIERRAPFVGEQHDGTEVVRASHDTLPTAAIVIDNEHIARHEIGKRSTSSHDACCAVLPMLSVSEPSIARCASPAYGSLADDSSLESGEFICSWTSASNARWNSG